MATPWGKAINANPGPGQKTVGVSWCKYFWNQRNIKVSFHTLTWVNDLTDGNALLFGHEAQNWEDRESSNKTGAAVQQTQPQTVPEHTHNQLHWEVSSEESVQISVYFHM